MSGELRERALSRVRCAQEKRKREKHERKSIESSLRSREDVSPSLFISCSSGLCQEPGREASERTTALLALPTSLLSPLASGLYQRQGRVHDPGRRTLDRFSLFPFLPYPRPQTPYPALRLALSLISFFQISCSSYLERTFSSRDGIFSG